MAYSISSNFILLMILCSTSAHPAKFNDKTYSDLVEELRLQVAPGTCASGGYTSGCCTGSCRVTSGSTPCYCDRLCHLFGDCCSDIASIGCLPNKCFLAGLNRGCCKWSPGNSCYVRGGSCYCDPLCRIFKDCCPDVLKRPCSGSPTTTSPPVTTTPTTAAPLTTPSPSPPSNCTTLRAGEPSGCCTGGPSNCVVYPTNKLPCYCHVGCYAEGNCCDDKTDIGCYPQNCQQATLTCCNPSAANDYCKVQTGISSSCYCNSDCDPSGGDCCPDYDDCSTTRGSLQLTRLLQMKQLARLMANIPSQEWSNFRAANLRRRFPAGLEAQMQQERPREFQQNYYSSYDRK